MLDARIYAQKFALDESTLKLKLSYILLMVVYEEQINISNDDDLCIHLMSIDKENRRYIFLYGGITISKIPEKLLRMGKGSFKYEI